MNATGTLHTCVHEDEEYGNILQDDLKHVYQNKMSRWHDKEKMIFEGCKGCDYSSIATQDVRWLHLHLMASLGQRTLYMLVQIL